MPSFFEQLDARAENTLLCVGLDPRSKSAPEALRECLQLIALTQDYAAAYKPNAAFFERYGAEGWKALADLIAAIPAHIPCILDAKRGDIASTADAYATSAFQGLRAGAITASPYMGHDSLEPFLKYKEKGVFVLCRTSNKGGADLQQLQLAKAGGSTVQLYEEVAVMASERWNTRGNVGLVVGATEPEALRRVRSLAPKLWMLVPGVGAQGGSLEASLRAGLRSDGKGVLINVSRGISGATDPRAAAKELVDEMNAIRRSLAASSSPTRALMLTSNSSPLNNLANALVVSSAVRFGTFTLKSGKTSPIYIDLRRLVAFPRILAHVAKDYARVLQHYQFDHIAGLPYAALPIATAISLEMGRPLIYPRKEAKAYGTKVAIEGDFKRGDRIVVVDDLVSTGETKVEAIDKLKSAGLEIVAIVVLIDREMGAKKLLHKLGYHLEAVAGLYQLLPLWEGSGAITHAQAEEVRRFLSQWNPTSSQPKL